ncbi:ring-hydroxylating dioxygenase, large terminal subunit [Caulobacter sp. AP07]|uniref:aromatic ring-hydroxylating dioxygenase subunit alpha n=1 Tax=Caulobacter sp. AP07 TaxID=1144304 RepID=UPI000271E8BF|nr:aromatic ring-hydroxylating dioxygenase subunit alpha [Caulobacter sp. AP07]EJL30762.1 ring-hydroxylating dioxygenase, large terminal subunit [Caulobacter sp. AP07]
MTYLYNAWYAAAWSHEISETLFSRTFLDIPVVLYRNAEAKVIALHDRCPHRFAPLSMGQIVEGRLRCGYHGLSFDEAGACVHSLMSTVAPKAAKVRAFAVHEQDKMVWIWMGDAAPGDTAAIPRLPHHTDEVMSCNFGLTTAKADYRLLSDNLMDLTHTALLHPAFGGLDYIAKTKSWEEDGQVVSDHVVEDMPAFFAPGTDLKVHNRDTIRWIAPATHILESRITPMDDANWETYIPSAHILTPESRKTTHYFWSSASHKDSGVSDEAMMATLIQAFDFEDKPMVEAVQQRMGDADLWDLNPVLLPADAGGVRVRRRLAALIESEQAARAAEAVATPAG